MITTLVVPGLLKRATAIVWVLGASLSLWFLSFGLKQEFSFKSFLGVAAIAVGWSAAYHFFVEILSASFEKSNRQLWRSLFAYMIAMLSTLILGGACVALDVLVWPGTGTLGATAILLMFTLLWWFGNKIDKAFRSILQQKGERISGAE